MECDTLASIALKFDTTTSDVARANNKLLDSSCLIYPGEVRVDAKKVPPFLFISYCIYQIIVLRMTTILSMKKAKVKTTKKSP